MDWIAYTIVPSLLVIVAERKPTLLETVRVNLKSLAWRWILGGFALTVLAYGIQIVGYRPHLTEQMDYLHAQSGLRVGSAAALVRKLVTLGVKTGTLAGPALCLGALLGLWALWKRRTWPPLIRGCVLYPLTFVASGLVLATYFTNESHMYYHLAFPLACLTAYGCQLLRSKLGYSLLGILMLPGLLAGMAQAVTKHRISETARVLFGHIARTTQPEELVLTNMQPYRPPFADWDEAGLSLSGILADRSLQGSVQTKLAFDAALARFAPYRPTVVFLRAPQMPVDATLENHLRRKARLRAQLEIPVPEEPENPVRQWRVKFLQLAGRLKPMESMRGSSLRLDVYELSAEAKADSLSAP